MPSLGRRVELYRHAMAPVLDLTPQALADLRVPLILAAVSMSTAFVTAWMLWKHGRTIAPAAALALGMAGFFVAANLAYVDLEPFLLASARDGDQQDPPH
jgi:hypothetical protein